MKIIVQKFIHLYRRLSPAFRRRIIGIFILLALLNISVWVFAFWESARNPTLIGLVLLAYGLGLRHAVDADHIAAIDNTTRKLMQEGKRPVAVGFFFSLGHSTIVILLSILIALSASFVTKNLPSLQALGSIIGTAVSSFFLLMIGIINLVTLIDIFKIWSRVTRGKISNEKEIHEHLNTKGFLARLFMPFLRAVSNSWNMYFVGFLFGLGFDTASEVGLLSLSAATAAKGTSLWAILLLPFAFTAGMSLIDTLDGILMLGAYGWAYLNPVRKLYYNMNITLISVIIALCIGGIEAIQLLSSQLHLTGPVFQYIQNMNFGSFGYLIIVAFIVSWIISITVYRIKGYDKIDLNKVRTH